MQLGEFTLRKQAMRLVPKKVYRVPDFTAVLGEQARPAQQTNTRLGHWS